MTSPAHTTAFFSLLATEQQLIEQFIQLLQEEQRILVAGGKDDLLPVTTAKTKLTEELMQQGAKRTAHMTANGIPVERDNLSAWIKRQDSSNQTRWTRFLALASEAQSLNNMNGRLVAERLSSNQQAIQSLMAAANRPATYGPDGQTSSLARGRTLGSA